MGGFIKGDVVVVPFPFSDLSNSKRRPAIVLADIQTSLVRKVNGDIDITFRPSNTDGLNLLLKSNLYHKTSDLLDDML